jgi:acetoin utilization protein AcuB
MNERRKKLPVVGAVMTSFPYFVDADDTVAKVERLMDEREIRHLPVQEKGRVVGIVSERDLHHFIKRSAPVEEKNSVRARDIMVADPYVVSFNTPLNEVVSEMAKRHIGSAIVTRSGKLAGVLSANDVCRILGEYLESRFGADGGDDAA